MALSLMRLFATLKSIFFMDNQDEFIYERLKTMEEGRVEEDPYDEDEVVEVVEIVVETPPFRIHGLSGSHLNVCGT